MKDANGRFVKGELANVAAMQTRTGWGADYADDIRNGGWEYTMFNADGTFNEKADIKSCFNCRKPHDKQNFVMSWAQLSGAASQGSAKAASADGVVIKDFAFGPANYATAPGKEITWTNTDDSPHQIGIQGKNLKTGVLQKGQSEKLILDAPGAYNYNCTASGNERHDRG